MKNAIIFSLCVTTLVSGCKKSSDSPIAPPVCTALTAVQAVPAALSVAKGSNFLYRANPVFGAGTAGAVTYTWTIPAEGTRTTVSDSIVNIDYKHAGWWRVAAKNTCDGVIKTDSFQLAVTPQCNNTVNNIFNFTGFLTGNVTFVNTKQKDGVYAPGSNSYFGIQADDNNPATFASIVLVFHPQYKIANLPPTGGYTTCTLDANKEPVFGAGDTDKCFISYVAYNTSVGVVVYKSDPNQSIYITNQNGKLKAVLCSVGLSGKSSLTGLTYYPVATGALAVP